MVSKSFDFEALYHAEKLNEFDHQFLKNLEKDEPFLHQQLLEYRNGKDFAAAPVCGEVKAMTLSEFIIALAVPIERTIAQHFDIEESLAALSVKTLSHDPIFQFKKWFVARLAKRHMHKHSELLSFSDLDGAIELELKSHRITISDKELAVSQLGAIYLADQVRYADAINQLRDWTVQAILSEEGRATTKHWVALQMPNKRDAFHLVPTQNVPGIEGAQQGMSFRHRDGFDLTDQGMSKRQVQNEVHYCVYCHEKEGDFCSSGFPVKKNQPDLGLKKDVFDSTLTGCPLEEKISEMHVLMREGYPIAALAMIMRDNPMCPATGHRICNDCMQSCIYQKQDPVNIPQIETGVLSDVLSLPWGVEIFNLLLRWNPLRQTQYLLQPFEGKKIAIMGMGPAGFSLAYHLLMSGQAVVGLDGLKIEPLPEQMLKQPIRDFESIVAPLSERVTWGFGGVAEYGITVRWNKNFLTLIYLSLCRFQHFQVFGSVRFGGTFLVEDAWRLGFDHLAVAVGAGLPKALPIPGSLAVGMRQANDFLMALQLTGANKMSHMANLQVQLPALVIGGGLTAVDTATEVQAYYLLQIEKVLLRYEALVADTSDSAVMAHFPNVDAVILKTWLDHARELREERMLANQEGRQADFIKLLRSWGGVSIVYRKTIQESPAYKLNHEELIKALEEGIVYLSELEPVRAICDENGHIASLLCQQRMLEDQPSGTTSAKRELLAKNIFVATGAKPNVAYGFEHAGTFDRNRYEYMAFQDQAGKLHPFSQEGHCKEAFGAFTSYDKDNKRVSFLGDTHPMFHGSVVKAIASAKRSYPAILASLTSSESKSHYADFAKNIADTFSATVVSSRALNTELEELVIRAPAAAYHFQPGHFYRLQTWENSASWINDTCLQSDGLTLLGGKVNQSDGTLTFVVPLRHKKESESKSLRESLPSGLLSPLSSGESVSLMGPTGVRMKVPEDPENILMLCGVMSIAFAVSYGEKVRAAGSRFYVAIKLSEGESPYYLETLHQHTDGFVMVKNDTGMQDIRAWLESDYHFDELNRVIIHGEAPCVKSWRHWLSAYREDLRKDVICIASAYGPMQCMLKGVCAQCLQWQIDPKTGKRTKAVYTCSWQDQPLDIVDWSNIDERLAQNHTQEILSALWLDKMIL